MATPGNTPSDPPPDPFERIAEGFERLKKSSTELNKASTEIGAAIRRLDGELQELNLGVKTWVDFGGWEEQDGEFEDQQLGYSKVGPKWGIAIRVIQGHREWPDRDRTDGEWLFNDAPRALRANAIDKLPDLIESLVKVADDTAANIRAKTDTARGLAKAVSAVSAKAK